MCSNAQRTLTSGSITIHLRHSRLLLWWESTYSEVEAKKAPQSSGLRTVIVPSCCSRDTIKRQALLLLSENTRYLYWAKIKLILIFSSDCGSEENISFKTQTTLIERKPNSLANKRNQRHFVHSFSLLQPV